MQQGMLYDSLAAHGAGMYVIQVVYRLRGPLHRAAFARAWEELVTRHPILRTSFHWEGRERPVQSVHRRAQLPVAERDWRGLAPTEQASQLRTLLEDERRLGFDLKEPPLLRLFLIQVGDELHDLVLVHHHLLLDGWCKDLLFREAFAFYQAFERGTPLELPLPRAYRDYILWLRGHDFSEAQRFWTDELEGFREPTSLWPDSPPGKPASDYAEHRFELAPSATEELLRFGRLARLTPNTIVQGMWALLLSRVSGCSDVVFGATVSGRPAALEGVESMVGLFINTLPVRVRLSADSGVVSWLQALQLRQARARDYGYSSLAQIRRWSEVKGGRPLFETIVVFENNPGFGGAAERYGEIEVHHAGAVIRNSLPLTLRCVPARPFSFQILYDCRRFSLPTILQIGDDLNALLHQVSRDPNGCLRPLLETLEESERRRRQARVKEFDDAVRRRLVDRVRAARHDIEAS